MHLLTLAIDKYSILGHAKARGFCVCLHALSVLYICVCFKGLTVKELCVVIDTSSFESFRTRLCITCICIWNCSHTEQTKQSRTGLSYSVCMLTSSGQKKCFGICDITLMWLFFTICCCGYS